MVSLCPTEESLRNSYMHSTDSGRVASSDVAANLQSSKEVQCPSHVIQPEPKRPEIGRSVINLTQIEDYFSLCLVSRRFTLAAHRN